MVIDSHCHLADEAFAGDLEAVVARAVAAEVSEALCILSADDLAELDRAERVRRVWPAVRFSAGVHPHAAGRYRDSVQGAVSATRAALERFEAVAVGEIGLDYHYDFAPRDVQQRVFAAHVELAVETGRPIVVHTREATADTLAVIDDAGTGKVGGVMHCFTGTVDEARQALDRGFHVSLSGIVTFPRSAALRELARFVPVDRLLVETDAPFLAPVPHRGRRNEPAWVVETAAAVALARGVDVADLGRQVMGNFTRFVDGSGSH